MTQNKIWLSSPHMGGNEQNYIKEAFAANWVAPLGPNVNGLEQDLENYLDANAHVGALSSGTAAIHLGLIILGVQAGDEVICQSFTFSASANPILYQGAIPVFVDSEEQTWNLCPVALEEAILDRILKDKAIFYATQARDAAPHYQHSEIGYNYRMSNICAGIGRGQMEVLDEHVALRRAMHDFYVDIFASIEGVDVFSTPNDDYFANYWLTAITIDATKTNGISRETLRLALEAENIESRPLWKPMHLQPIFERYSYYGSNVAETLFDNGLCLPSGSNLTDNDSERIEKVIKAVFG